MSELINTSGRGKQLLWQLMGTASVLVLLGAATASVQARGAEDEDRPTVWIELGGALQRVDTSEEKYAPPFLFGEKRPDPETVDPLSVGHLPRNAFEGEGRITFAPQGSSWNFSAAARFGRSEAHQRLHEQSSATAALGNANITGFIPPYQHVFQFIDVKQDSEETHAILDFQVGKDVGFGMFGRGSSSVVSAGVRFAQFDSKSSTTFASDPDAYIHVHYFTFGAIRAPAITNAYYHNYHATAAVSRNFHGLGPSLSWNASAPIIGTAQDGEVVLDWGLNAAILFGRQKANVHHQSTAQYHHGKYAYTPRITEYPDRSPDKHRSKMVTVPNIGAFASLTYQIQNFRIRAGYRADFFFGAMDGGLDTRQTEDEKFYGPFATVSLGL